MSSSLLSLFPTLVPLTLFIIAGTYLALGMYAWRRRASPAAISFALMMALMSLWSLGYALEIMAETLGAKIFWAKVEYFGIVSVPVLWFLCAAEYSGHREVIASRRWSVLWFVPLVTLLLVWTNEMHNLIWRYYAVVEVHGLRLLWLEHGPFFWLHSAYSYALFSFGVFYLFAEIWKGTYRAQAAMMVVGVVVPALANIIYLAGINVVYGLDLTPFGFLFSAVAILWGISRYRLLDFAPATDSAILSNLRDGVIVTDERRRISYINPTGAQIFGREAREAVGQPLEWLCGECGEALSRMLRSEEEQSTIPLQVKQEARIFQVQVVNMQTTARFLPPSLFHIIILRDVTHKERERFALKRREAILRAVGVAAERFLTSASWEKNIPYVLKSLGQAADASRVYLFENTGGENGSLLTSQRYEWAARDITPQITNPALQNFSFRASGFARWEEMLGKGEAICGLVRDFPPSEREVLEAQDIRSIAVMPIFVQGDFWGFIGFDECRYERVWSEAELGALRIAADIIGAALTRGRIEEALRYRQEALRRLNEIVGMALESPDLSSMAQVLVEHLGSLLEADTCFLSLWNEEQQKVTPLAASHPNHRTYLDMIFLTDEKTLTAAALDAGRSVVIDDVMDSPYLSPRLAESFPGHAALAVPLMAMGRKMGALIFGFSRSHVFTSDEIALAETAARQISLAMAKTRLLDETQRRLRDLQTLRDAAQAVARAVSENELIEHITRIIGTRLAPERFGVWLLDEETHLLRPHPTCRGNVDMQEEIPLGEGAIGWVARTATPLRVDSADRLQEHLRIGDRARAALCVPIKLGESVIGVVHVESEKAVAFTSDDERLLEALAGQLAMGIGRLRTVQAERIQAAQLARSSALLSALAEVVARITRQSDPDDVLQTLGEELRKLGLSILITRYLSEANVLRVLYTNIGEREVRIIERVSGMKLHEMRFPLDALPEDMNPAHSSRPRFLDEPVRYVEMALSRFQNRSIESILRLMHIGPNVRVGHFPLIAEERPLGVLWMWGETLRADDLKTMGIFASQVAIVLEKARLFADVQRLAAVDDLTGLYNRRRFFDLAYREFYRARRYGRPLSILMVDIDHFKKVNDRYGHPAGDQVLQNLAAAMRRTLRNIDIIGRYGGEEFIILLAETDVETAQQVAERIRAQIADVTTALETGEEIRVTVSVGVAGDDVEEMNLVEMVELSDQALYAAKNAGRNRVKVYRHLMDS